MDILKASFPPAQNLEAGFFIPVWEEIQYSVDPRWSPLSQKFNFSVISCDNFTEYNFV